MVSILGWAQNEAQFSGPETLAFLNIAPRCFAAVIRALSLAHREILAINRAEMDSNTATVRRAILACDKNSIYLAS
jgi:hypothetical protein